MEGTNDCNRPRVAKERLMKKKKKKKEEGTRRRDGKMKEGEFQNHI
jgi:hypothetical protein